MANGHVRTNDTRSKKRPFSPVSSIYDTASALMYLAGKEDDDDRHHMACILATLSDNLRHVGERMDDEEWEATREFGQ